MDVKNKVDKDVVENVVKEDKPTKPDADEKNTSYELGKSVGYLEALLDSEKITRKASKNAAITGMFMGAGVVAIGYLVGCELMTILSNKHHN